MGITVTAKLRVGDIHYSLSSNYDIRNIYAIKKALSAPYRYNVTVFYFFYLKIHFQDIKEITVLEC